MKELKNVTLICADCIDPQRAINVLYLCQEEFKFARTILFTDEHMKVVDADIDVISIPRIKCIEEYSHFMMFNLVKYIKTSHVLIVQWDGFIINPQAWNDEFLNYDYIGAPWWYSKNNVGNGGFSLRSLKLLWATSCENFKQYHPEDDAICRTHHDFLESNYDIKYAPESVAKKFSYEPNIKYPDSDLSSFGFHGIELIHHALCRK